MDFFGVGMGEILLIIVVALIIWGPGRMVEIARTLGKMVRTLKKATFDLTAEVTKEIDREEKDLKCRQTRSSSGKAKESVAASKVKPQHRGN